MKILIIGIDALEYDLVEKYNLNNLKQVEYGEVVVPLVRKYPETPNVWASFLTGKNEKARFEIRSNMKFCGLFIRFLDFLRGKFNPGWGIMNFLHKKLNCSIAFSKLKSKTFLDTLDSDYCCLPFYDFIEKNPSVFERSMDFKDGRISYNKYKKFLDKNFQKNKNMVFDKLKNSKAELFFCYFNYLDHLQHHFFKNESTIEGAYKEFDKIVGELKNIAEADLVLVVSDHGQKKGIHTKYGFYSLSKKLNLMNPKITDFYDLFMDQFKLPRREEEGGVIEHMKSLGYF